MPRIQAPRFAFDSPLFNHKRQPMLLDYLLFIFLAIVFVVGLAGFLLHIKPPKN